jgi:hypothetical protein
MESLKSVLQRRPINLTKNVLADLDHEVRADTEDRTVESSVVNGAHGDAVWNDRLASLGVLSNVRGIQELCMS